MVLACFGHLKTKFFTIKTFNNIGLGGPWCPCCLHFPPHVAILDRLSCTLPESNEKLAEDRVAELNALGVLNPTLSSDFWCPRVGHAPLWPRPAAPTLMPLDTVCVGQYALRFEERELSSSVGCSTNGWRISGSPFLGHKCGGMPQSVVCTPRCISKKAAGASSISSPAEQLPAWHIHLILGSSKSHRLGSFTLLWCWSSSHVVLAGNGLLVPHSKCCQPTSALSEVHHCGLPGVVFFSSQWHCAPAPFATLHRHQTQSFAAATCTLEPPICHTWSICILWISFVETPHISEKTGFLKYNKCNIFVGKTWKTSNTHVCWRIKLHDMNMFIPQYYPWHVSMHFGRSWYWCSYDKKAGKYTLYTSLLVDITFCHHTKSHIFDEDPNTLPTDHPPLGLPNPRQTIRLSPSFARRPREKKLGAC